MTTKTAVLSILALASIGYYLLSNGLLTGGTQSHPGQKVQEADQRNQAKEAEEHREAEMQLHCLAVAEAEYVSDLEREYNNARARATFRRDGRYDLDPEIHHRLERRKENSVNSCQKEYGQTPAPSP